MTHQPCFILGCFSRICHVDCKLSVLYNACSFIGFSSNIVRTLTNYRDIMLVYWVVWSNSRHPSLTGVLCLSTGVFIYLFIFTGTYVQSCEHPSLTGFIYLCKGFMSKIVDTLA